MLEITQCITYGGRCIKASRFLTGKGLGDHKSLDIRARGEDCASIPAEERPVRRVRLATWDPLNESEGEISGGTTSAKVCLYSLHKAPFRVPSSQNLS